ncbi:MAG: NADP-reducing hydrogenase subunit HndC [Firmicutes bacterium ADurb.Bin153]|nr:MAG: NADP-reducing hydrogenase subunit HndC [Firmicutes bacterium ADurb.Bin153]
MVNLTINGKSISVPEGTTIIEAAKAAGIRIPSLCYMKGINEIGACRVCLVEVEGARGLVTSCTTKVSEGMVVRTNSPAAKEARKAVVELIISNHPYDCLKCVRSGKCELQQLANDMGIREISYEGEKSHHEQDKSTFSIVRDPDKCVLCRRCVAVCAKVQGVGAVNTQGRGFGTVVAPEFELPMNSTSCAMCGQCVLVCPTGALTERDSTGEVWRAINDPVKHVVVQTAPAVRVALGEEFGMEPGSLVTGKMVAALRRLGFDKVFDTDFTADLTIIEEGTELLHRALSGGKLPMITSCSPGWIKYCEHYYGDRLDHLSTCKSPQQMFGALAKTYYAQKAGIDPKSIFSVSVMPCTAKKFECERPEMVSSGYKDVDAVLTTRELARMIRESGLDLNELEPEEYDAPFGISTGAAVIFGATGGVMEAALRTVYEIVTGTDLGSNLDFVDVRGMEGIKQMSVKLPENLAAPYDKLSGLELKFAVAHTLKNASQVMDMVRSDTAPWHFIEVMACPGGCIGGGGQPIGTDYDRRVMRIEGTYAADKSLKMRKSHDNPAVRELYNDYLIEPLGHKSHELLHTHYEDRGRV